MKKGSIFNLIIILILLSGLSLLLYPTVSDRLNARKQSKVIDSYSSSMSAMEEPDFEQHWQQARAFNANIPQRSSLFTLEGEELEAYEAALNVSGDSVMGYVEIPKLNCSMPLYHGTDDAVMQRAIGHLEWTSLPTGDKGSHAVFSGHRGLPSARLFTDLDELELGDSFSLRVLDQEFFYEVDQILVVEPQDTEALRVVEGMDYCTLMTCTPYGINTHRLLVRGHRVDSPAAEEQIRVPTAGENNSEDPTLRLIAIAVFGCAAVFTTAVYFSSKKREAGK